MTKMVQRFKFRVQALPQVDENIWSWGIPGWRQDLIEALLKALPKDKRRQCSAYS